MKTKPTQTKTNLESQTALQAIKALEKLAVNDIVLEALANEVEIGRLADRIAQTLTILARDYTATAETFVTHGAVALVNICNDLPELKTQLVCRIEARKLYKNLLK
jgi:hypothetical protein